MTSPEQSRGLLSVLLAPFRFVIHLVTAFTGPWTRTNGVSWLKLIVFILILRWAFFEMYSIPSSSMEPVLHGDPRFLRGDRVAVNKALFGPRIPFTTTRIFKLGEPKRWDIVVFNNVDPNAEHKTLIKRVVGLPGEKVFIWNGQIHIDGEPIEPPEHLREVLYYTRGVTRPYPQVRDFILNSAQKLKSTDAMDLDVYGAEVAEEDLRNLSEMVSKVDLDTLSDAEKDRLMEGVRTLTFQMLGEIDASQFDIPSGFKYGLSHADRYANIPEGHYFMLGDNSGHSGDGRAFGWVPHENLYGRAFAVALPFSRMKDLTGFSETWWGRLLLFGIPGLFVLHEFLRAFVVLSWRVGRENESGELKTGERIRINRLAYGLRIPFSRRYVAARAPKPGDLLAYLRVDEESGHAHLQFSRVDKVAGDSATVRTDNKTTHEVARRELVGRAESVWWPISQRRSINAPAQD